MMAANDISNRHLLPADGLEDVPEGQEQSVRIVVAKSWAASTAGQLLVSCLVNLLCRQVGLIKSIEVVAPASDLQVRLPSGDTHSGFPSCLEQVVEWAVEDRVRIWTTPTDSITDCTIVIGESEGATALEIRYALYVIGDGWRAWAGAPEHAPRKAQPGSTNPLGPFLGACLAAGEVFKRGRGLRRGRYLDASGYSLWSGQTESDWDALEDGPEIEGLTLPDFYIVGAGAVGNGASYLFSNARLRSAYAVLIDDDSYDETSLNRCLLAGWNDKEEKKVFTVAAALNAAGVEAYPFPGTVKEFLFNTKPGLRPDILEKIGNLEFDVVLSCVDRGMSRKDIQGLKPGLLMGGSTLDLISRANTYNLSPGAACLACFNPAENDGEKIRALEDELRHMAPETRNAFLQQHGLDAKDVDDYLNGAPCGGLGEAALKAFATRPLRQFSVGFVSLSAALLLCTALLRHTVFAGHKMDRCDMTTMNFLNGGFVDSGLGADDHCEAHCNNYATELSST